MTENIQNYVFLEKFQFFNKMRDEIKNNIKFIRVFSYNFITNDLNVILVTNDDKVYGFGDNLRGVLGFGHQKELKEFTINEELCNKQIVDFRNSLLHTIARTIDGKIYCWGYNESGLLGDGIVDYKIYKPDLIKYFLNENIIDMSCGIFHTLFLTQKSEVYVWAYNIERLIPNLCNKDVLNPYKLNELNTEKVKQISCGFYHSLALTESGCVYSWGRNDWGQLGTGTDDNSNSPKLIKLDKEITIKKICCGHSHSLLLTTEGHIYGFGSNKSKELANITEDVKLEVPKKLIHFQKFIEIASHLDYNISCALSENNIYYVWGEGGDELIENPIETHFQSFNEVFAHYYYITPNNSVVLSGKYMKNWLEISELGSGNFGTVFKVSHFSNHDFYAIKKIQVERSNKNLYEYLKKEFDISLTIVKLKSDFLVQYYDVWIENDFQIINGLKEWSENYAIFIQMELCDTTLSEIHEQIKSDSKLHSTELLTKFGFYLMSEIYIEILKGVKYLHNINIIHRDLKPDNILFKSGTVKIGDFGLAKAHDINMPNTGDLGQWIYAAPEVRNYEKYDTRADIYSLGVILQQLFNIDVNREYSSIENQTSLLLRKYENIKLLSIDMTKEDYRERPNTEIILNDSEKWTINRATVHIEDELNVLLQIHEKNYIQNMIYFKLKNIKHTKH